MRLNRCVASAVVAGLAVGGISLAVAPVASAASSGCDYLNSIASVLVGTSNHPSLTFVAGETIVASVSDGVSTTASLQVPHGTIVGLTSTFPATLSYTIPADTTVDVEGRATLPVTWDWSCTETATPIADWVQAYGRLGPNATCETGWNPSWQQWAEAVTGGWVCTRTIPSLG